MKMESHGARPEAVSTAAATAGRIQRTFRYPGFFAVLCFWTAIGALSFARSYFLLDGRGFPGNALAGLLAYIACYLPWAGFTPIVFRLERRFPLGEEHWLRSFGVLLLASLPVCAIASPLMIGLSLGVSSLLGTPAPPMGTGMWTFWLREIPVAEALFWCSVAGGYFIRSLMKLQQRERDSARLALEKSQLETSLRQAQLEALHARLNPHFLFNSLQNISVLAQQDPRTASQMLAKLGDLLRAVLKGETKPETTLREEIELARAYCAIENLRFGDRLQTMFLGCDDLQSAMVPRFLLQPLIENAIVHGMRGSPDRGVIAVDASRAGDKLVLTVVDNGAGPPSDELEPMKLGLGLGTTCEVLARLYPESHTISMRRSPEGGTEVCMTIPLRLQPLPNEAVVSDG
jgi:hypothetical protein